MRPIFLFAFYRDNTVPSVASSKITKLKPLIALYSYANEAVQSDNSGIKVTANSTIINPT